MANLYLIDQPYGENGLALARHDNGAVVVLIQDGVYLDASDIHQGGGTVYAVRQDLERRGLEARTPGFVQRIDYPELVELVLQHKVINFA